MIDSGGLTFTAKADGDIQMHLAIKHELLVSIFLFKDLIKVIDYCSTLSHKIYV